MTFREGAEILRMGVTRALAHWRIFITEVSTHIGPGTSLDRHSDSVCLVLPGVRDAQRADHCTSSEGD